MPVWPVGAVLLVVVVNAHAQAPPPASSLPPSLTGRWTTIGPGGVFSDTFALTFDGDRQPGPVTGRASFRGVVCGSKDEPFQGTWDGTELRLQGMHRANVNTARMANAQCGAVVYVLRPGPSGHSFAGEGRMEGSNAVAKLEVAP